MVELILMRHGKAVSSTPAGDHARSLSPRGLAEAAEAGTALLRLGLPDFALVSDARRTRETFDRVVESAGRPIAHRFEPDLYGASPRAILAAVASAPKECRRLLVVGHNPGIGDLARQLSGPDESDLAATMEGHFPTSALALVRLEIDRWAQAKAGGRLEAYIVPQAWRDSR
ncbi:MAG TPA: histidine phosphatase family protein [Lichenihabitans sp.]|jgi:phosphohistidine phosphatase|nr:histidine phosphatase family protein [Lichenihabitans sp.]